MESLFLFCVINLYFTSLVKTQPRVLKMHPTNGFLKTIIAFKSVAGSPLSLPNPLLWKPRVLLQNVADIRRLSDESSKSGERNNSLLDESIHVLGSFGDGRLEMCPMFRM